ncbi:MAG: hypothetical protein QXV23_06205 [Candidatus Bathyarchaeia archaeon]
MVSPFLIFLLVSLPLINIPNQTIDTNPDVVKYYNSTVITLRPDYQYSTCPQEATSVILSEIPNALKNHRDAVIRFIGEYGYDELLSLRISVSENGIVPIYARDLPERIGGTTSVASSVGKVLAIWIEINCNVAYVSPSYRQAIILHEIYHALGLDHPPMSSPIELMNGLTRNSPPYPSSLNLYALWQLWFGKDQTSSVRLPPNIPYVQVLPYNYQMSQLEIAVKQLQFTLNNDIRRIDADITSLRNDVNNLKSVTGNLAKDLAELSNLKSVTNNLAKNQNYLQNQLTDMSNEMRNRTEDLQSRLNILGTEISRSLDRQALDIASLKQEVIRLNQELKLTVMVSVSLITAMVVLSFYMVRRGRA